MPSRPKRGRHRAPRQPLKKGAIAVPAVLLAAGGGAFAGLAGVPAAGGPTVRAAAAADVAPLPVALPRNTYAKDLDVLDAAAAREQERKAAAQQRARVAAAERASRTRRAQLDAQAKAKAEAAKRAAAAAAAERARLRSLYVRPSSGSLTSEYGPRWGRLHAGLDFGAAYGSPIRSVAAGEVVGSGYNSGYGNYVHVQHSDGVVTTYNHMSKILRRGGSVDPGDVLGLVGSTGNSTGPHLHFEVRVGGEPIDPTPWLRRKGVDI